MLQSLPVEIGANLSNVLMLLCLGPIKRCTVLRICAASGLCETHSQQTHESDGLFKSRLNCRERAPRVCVAAPSRSSEVTHWTSVRVICSDVKAEDAAPCRYVTWRCAFLAAHISGVNPFLKRGSSEERLSFAWQRPPTSTGAVRTEK
jgi:hypothetical protein